MKKYVLIVLVMALVQLSYAQTDVNLETAMQKVEKSTFPFYCAKRTPYLAPVQKFIAEPTSKRGLYTYRDLGGYQKNSNEEGFCDIFRWFEMSGTASHLIAVTIGRDKSHRQILVSYKNGKSVDFLESQTNFNNDIVIKQWQIGADEQILISWLKIEEGKVFLSDEDFNSLRAQRIDTYYKLNPQGKFVKVKEVKYQPQDYSRKYLLDKERNIWDGEETLE